MHSTRQRPALLLKTPEEERIVRMPHTIDRDVASEAARKGPSDIG